VDSGGNVVPSRIQPAGKQSHFVSDAKGAVREIPPRFTDEDYRSLPFLAKVDVRLIARGNLTGRTRRYVLADHQQRETRFCDPVSLVARYLLFDLKRPKHYPNNRDVVRAVSRSGPRSHHSFRSVSCGICG